VLWTSAGLILWTQAGYPVLLGVLRRVARPGDGNPAPVPAGRRLGVSLIVAAHREEGVIAGKVRNALALDWPRERLEVIVACDGSPDDTPARARAAGADVVLTKPITWSTLLDRLVPAAPLAA
jgi:cellulose synthase/poly-beta-1,6-N-acetylglucosamine synthase-like glycosyltransferase